MPVQGAKMSEPPAAAYEVAADALFHANELWFSFTDNPLAKSLGGVREARLRTAREAVDAIWPLAEKHLREQISAEILEGDPDCACAMHAAAVARGDIR